jgi:hypothetical protein
MELKRSALSSDDNKVKKRKSAAGRPFWTPTEERMAQAESLAACGLKLEDLARCLGISYQTMNERRKEYPEFSEAIKRGEAKGIATVASALIKNAKNGNVSAQIFYLKCRGKGMWRDHDACEEKGKATDEIKQAREISKKCQTQRKETIKA